MGHNSTQTAEPKSPSKEKASSPSSCVFDFEHGEIPHCIRKTSTSGLSISPQFLKELRFDSNGLAGVLSQTYGWMYVDRKGLVVINGVAWMDNGPDSFYDGRVRVIRDGKYGFANRN